MRRREIPPADGAAEIDVEATPDFVRDAIAAIAVSDDASPIIPPLVEAEPAVWAEMFGDGDDAARGGRARRRKEKPEKERRGDRKAAARLARLSAATGSPDADEVRLTSDPFAPASFAVGGDLEGLEASAPAAVPVAAEVDGRDDLDPTEQIQAVACPAAPEPEDLQPTDPFGGGPPLGAVSPAVPTADDLADAMPASVEADDPGEAARDRGVYSRRSPGPRVLARKRARRRTRTRIVGTIGVIALCAAALLGAWQLLPRGDSGEHDEPALATAPPAAAASTTERAGVAITNEAGRATSVVIFGVDPAGEGYGLVLPGATLVDIPGAGFEPIERTPEFGGADLLRVSLENFLGIPISGAAVFEPDLLATLAGDGVPVTVPAEITAQGEDGTLQVLFSPGAQVMDGETFARYVTYSGDGQVLQAGRVQAGFAALFARGFPAEPIERFEVLPELLPALGEPEFTLLPVEPRGIEGQEEIFEADRDGIQEILERKAPQTVAGEPAAERVRVEVLNGNGTVGITAPISEQLVELGYQVVLTDNADRFDYPDTHITIYEEALVDRAREIREVLGVGQVILSRAAPSYVDVTVLLGDDLTAARLESTGAGAPAG